MASARAVVRAARVLASLPVSRLTSPVSRSVMERAGMSGSSRSMGSEIWRRMTSCFRARARRGLSNSGVMRSLRINTMDLLRVVLRRCSMPAARSVRGDLASKARSSRMIRRTWRWPRAGSSCSYSWSEKRRSPALSLLRVAEKARTAATSAVYSALVVMPEPNCPEADRSTRKKTFCSRSSVKSLM